MANIYLTHSELINHLTRVAKTRLTEEGRLAVALEENILRPSGGGQPQDHGVLQTEYGRVPVGKIFKADGETWVEIDGPLTGGLGVGACVDIVLDGERRHQLSRCHSLIHLGMAEVRALFPGYESKGAVIADDASHVTLLFRSDAPPSPEALHQLDRHMRSQVHRKIPIRIERAKSMDDAAHCYSVWRVDPDNRLSGKIRVVHIEGVDANPCSGSHVTSTGEIGPFVIHGCRTNGLGVRELSIERTNTWMSW